MGFFSKTKKSEFVALFDIGSGSVGGAMLLVSKNKKPVVISSMRKTFKLKSEIDSSVLMKDMLVTLNDVAKSIQKESGMVPDNVYSVLSSPWASASLRTIKRKRDEDFTFTQKYAKEIIEEDVAKFKKDNLKFDQIIDRRVVNVLLNGYPIDSPHGKRVKSAEIHLFLSMSSSGIIEKIEDVIMSTYHRNVKFTSQMFSDFIVVRDIFDRVNDFIIIDVDEEVTEVSVMRDDYLVGTASMPFGKNTIIRKLASSMKKDIHETKSLFSLFKDGQLHEIHAREMTHAIQLLNREWISGMKSIFRGLFSDALIPHTIFLVSEGASKKWFSNLLDKSFFPEFTTTEDSFNVILGDNRILHDFCDFSSNAQNDSSLTMQSIFINKINFQ
jgi:cell division ATPase FtsA